MGLYDQSPFAFKVRSETAAVRFKVSNAQTATATITNVSGSCSQFEYMQIGP